MNNSNSDHHIIFAPTSKSNHKLNPSLLITFNCPGQMQAQPQSGALVLSDDLKNPALEKLDLVRKWSINTYKVIPWLPRCCSVFKLGVMLIVVSFLCSAPGRSSRRSWVEARRRWTWSWRVKSNSCATTRGSISMWSGWLRHWSVSSHRSCRRRGSWGTPSLTSASNHQNSMWVHTQVTNVLTPSVMMVTWDTAVTVLYGLHDSICTCEFQLYKGCYYFPA